MILLSQFPSYHSHVVAVELSNLRRCNAQLTEDYDKLKSDHDALATKCDQQAQGEAFNFFVLTTLSKYFFQRYSHRICLPTYK